MNDNALTGMRRFGLIGDGPHSRVISELLLESGHEIVSFVGLRASTTEFGSVVAESDLELHSEIGQIEFVPALGENSQRFHAVRRLSAIGLRIAGPVLATSANVSTTALIENGVVVMHGVTIQHRAKVGFGAIVNSNASVDHDCEVGAFAHIAPNVALAGGVKVGERTLIGVGASVAPGVTIGEDSVIGAGAVVLHDIPDSTLAVGVPARVIRRLDSTGSE